MTTPEATFDALYITSKVQRVTSGAAQSEVYLLAYLACLLTVFRGSPPSDWGYRFTSTKKTTPYSTELADGMSLALRSGAMQQIEAGAALTSRGEEEVAGLRQLQRFSGRVPFLEAACGSCLVMPLPTLNASLSAEPELRRSLQVSGSRELLDDTAQEALHRHFVALSEVVPEASDLLTPAIVWLTFLSESLEAFNDAS